MNVTNPGRSGLANAYTSVLSAVGSPATSGASRWLDAVDVPGPSPSSATPAATRSAATACLRRGGAVMDSLPVMGYWVGFGCLGVPVGGLSDRRLRPIRMPGDREPEEP